MQLAASDESERAQRELAVAVSHGGGLVAIGVILHVKGVGLVLREIQTDSETGREIKSERVKRKIP